MAAVVHAIDPRDPDPAVVRRAVDVLRAGGLVGLPTETVYGLAGLADDARAIERIYAAKGRPPTNPLIVHVPGELEARALCPAWPAAAEALAQRFWPGPLTLVVPRGSSIPPVVSAGLDTMAVRAPAHPVARAVLRALGRPLAAPSANPSNGLSPTRAAHVVKGLGDRVDLVLDAGPCALGIESTVVDLTRERAVLLRPGSIGIDALRAVLGLVDVHEGAVAGAAASPGLGAKHYAPRARLEVVARAELAAWAARAAAAVISHGAPVGALHERTLPDDATGYAAGLFDALHAMDESGCTVIVLEAPPDGAAWAGVRDRIARASAR